jgi:hypothetical protein
MDCPGCPPSRALAAEARDGRGFVEARCRRRRCGHFEAFLEYVFRNQLNHERRHGELASNVTLRGV